LQALQLAIEGAEFGAQGVLFAGAEGEVAAPLAQQQPSPLGRWRRAIARGR
jgi:hypothetical protein